MRLKEDKSSWNSSGIIKRDFKHDSSQSTRVRFHSKKDTRVWCKGRAGKKHNFERKNILRWSYFSERYTSRYLILQCVICKKRFHKKNIANLSYIPMKIEIDVEWTSPTPIPVNGVFSSRQLADMKR